MITSLRLINFKNFADETLRLGPFTVIVGANASGKSNIRDAFRFLRGIGLNYTLAEIMGGNAEAMWNPIRGTANEVARFGYGGFTLEVESKPTSEFRPLNTRIINYSIEIDRIDQNQGRFQVIGESLQANSETSYTSELITTDLLVGNGTESTLSIKFPADGTNIDGWKPDQPILRRITPYFLETLNPGGQRNLGADLLQALGCSLSLSGEFRGMKFLELSPDLMRQPTFPEVDLLGAHGENLPAVLKAICSDTARRNVLTSWLRELTPMDVEDLAFPPDPSGRVHLYLRETNGRQISAYSASDGTLRFLGMLAALLSEDEDGLLFIEEIDNGIHPSRLWLLIELIEKQTAKGGIQVIATTHSPDVLNFINDSTFENISVVYRDEHSADAVIRSVSELPNARELRRTQGLGRLHTSGWMETALAFSEGGYDETEGEE